METAERLGAAEAETETEIERQSQSVSLLCFGVFDAWDLSFI